MSLKQIIELVEKWIADPKSVSRKELRVAGVYAASAARDAAWCAVQSALNGAIDAAKRWVAKYHKSLND